MRFPPSLFGFPMTEGLWYIVVILAALLVFWLIMRILKNVIKDFASGMLIFMIIIVFGFLFVNVISGQNALEGSFGSWFSNIFN